VDEVEGLVMRNPVKFAETLLELATGEEDGLVFATMVARNLEDLKVVVAYVRRHMMLDENLRIGNGAEVARRSGLRRSRAHSMMSRAEHERIHKITIFDLIDGYWTD
tara:strand:+ start:121 stop:441 length:321 start_codon:yes stop_codon:yes gene_type:complete